MTSLLLEEGPAQPLINLIDSFIDIHSILYLSPISGSVYAFKSFIRSFKQ